MIVVSEMARELGERLLAALRRVEQLYQGSAVSAASAVGDPTHAQRPRAAETGGGDVEALDNDVPLTTGEEILRLARTGAIGWMSRRSFTSPRGN